MPPLHRRAIFNWRLRPTQSQEHLTVGEVWDLPFKKVTLVTLSACESALGDKEPDGGEITTLAEAFSSAGATTVAGEPVERGRRKHEGTHGGILSSTCGRPNQRRAALQSAEIKLLKNPKFSAAPLLGAFRSDG